MEKELQMAALLTGVARNRLVIRGLSEYVEGASPLNPRRQVSIYLLALCKVPGGDHGEFFEVHYTSEDDSTRWHKANRFEVNSLRASVSVPSDLDVSERIFAVWEWFQVWKQTTPPWVSTAEVVICDKDYSDNFSMLPLSHLRFMLHFTRLHGQLMQYGATTPSSWMVPDLTMRLGSFLKKRAFEWELVIG